MKHHIIAKYNDSVKDKQALLPGIRALFEGAKEIPGVCGAEVFPNVIDRSNRYDIMIVVNMDKDALPVWDESEVHRKWKECYGAMLEKKAIFDCD